MEGLSFKSFSGEVTMRATDHQLQQPLYVATWRKLTDPKKAVRRRRAPAYTFVQERGVPAVRVEHADLLPDEAPRSLSSGLVVNPPARRHCRAGSF